MKSVSSNVMHDSHSP